MASKRKTSTALARTERTETQQRVYQVQADYSVGEVAEQLRISHEAGAASMRAYSNQLEKELERKDKFILELLTELRKRDGLALASIRLETEKAIRTKQIEADQKDTEQLYRLLGETTDKFLGTAKPLPAEARRALANLFQAPDELKDRVIEAVGREEWLALISWAKE